MEYAIYLNVLMAFITFIDAINYRVISEIVPSGKQFFQETVIGSLNNFTHSTLAKNFIDLDTTMSEPRTMMHSNIQNAIAENPIDSKKSVEFTVVNNQRNENMGAYGTVISMTEQSSRQGALQEYDTSFLIGPEVLVDVEPQEMVLSDTRRKQPVPDGFVWEQKMKLLLLHNLYRSNVTPPAGDMAFMEWDEKLSHTAQLWANGCAFRHGFPPNSDPMGQNLYQGWDPSGKRALLLWYEEYKDYDLETLTCDPGKQCGHYTQMAWADSTLVGCGMKRCGNRNFLIVCHYSPSGNIMGSAPYQVAKPCSQCSTQDGGLCSTNLCITREQCKRNPGLCMPECPLRCENCGILDSKKCRCRCPLGWDSLDCSRLCADQHERCGKKPGWPTKTYCFMNGNHVADKYCRRMCEKCNATEDGPKRARVEPGSCCGDILCPPGHVLDLERRLCRCRLLCPGTRCYGLSLNTLSHKNRGERINILKWAIFLNGVLLFAVQQLGGLQKRSNNYL